MRSTSAATAANKQNRTNPEYRQRQRLQKINSALDLYRMEPRSLSDTLIPGDAKSSKYEEVLIDNATESADARMMRREMGERIDRVMRECLSPREERVIRARFDFDGELTLQQIGDRYGLSRERIRQVQVEALGKLRRALRQA